MILYREYFAEIEKVILDSSEETGMPDSLPVLRERLLPVLMDRTHGSENPKQVLEDITRCYYRLFG